MATAVSLSSSASDPELSIERPPSEAVVDSEAGGGYFMGADDEKVGTPARCTSCP